MIKVLIYCRDQRLYKEEFSRRFHGKFEYIIGHNYLRWDNMNIVFVDQEPRGYSVDIAIGFNQDGVDIFTHKSCINIKRKRTTTYFDLLNAINNDGSFSWEKYLQNEEDDWLAEL